MTGDKVGLLVACGPSLKDVPLSFLQQYRSYSMNGIFYREGFTPSYYFVADKYFFDNNLADVTRMVKETEAWIRWPYHAQFGYKARPMHRVGTTWSFEPDVFLGLGGGVIFQCLQVAYWHGIQTLLVVGLDHDFFAYTELPKHFDDRYIKTNVSHHQYRINEFMPLYGARQKKTMESGFTIARRVFEKSGGRIINLTEGSQCDVFEKGDINDWIVDNSE